MSDLGRRLAGAARELERRARERYLVELTPALPASWSDGLRQTPTPVLAKFHAALVEFRRQHDLGEGG